MWQWGRRGSLWALLQSDNCCQIYSFSPPVACVSWRPYLLPQYETTNLTLSMPRNLFSGRRPANLSWVGWEWLGDIVRCGTAPTFFDGFRGDAMLWRLRTCMQEQIKLKNWNKKPHASCFVHIANTSRTVCRLASPLESCHTVTKDQDGLLVTQPVIKTMI